MADDPVDEAIAQARHTVEMLTMRRDDGLGKGRPFELSVPVDLQWPELMALVSFVVGPMLAAIDQARTRQRIVLPNGPLPPPPR